MEETQPRWTDRYKGRGHPFGSTTHYLKKPKQQALFPFLSSTNLKIPKIQSPAGAFSPILLYDHSLGQVSSCLGELGCQNLLVLSLWLPCQFINKRLLSSANPAPLLLQDLRAFCWMTEHYCWTTCYNQIVTICRDAGICFYLFIRYGKKRGLEYTQDMSIKVCPPCEQTYLCRQEGHALLFQPYHDLI